MPRDGPRVLRGPGHRRGDEPALRQHQGGPGGTPGPGQDLPDGAPLHRPARRRLAADDVPDARRPRALLRRHLLPQHGEVRHALLHPGPGTRRRVLPGPRRRRARPGGCAARGLQPARARRQRRRFRTRRPAARWFPRNHRAAGRPGTRRLRRRTQVPPPHDHRSPPASLAQQRARRAAGQGRALLRGADAEAHGRGRHLRSPGRRVLPLLGRPALDHPPLREDALRQRAPARALRADVPDQRGRELPDRRPGNRRLGPPGDALAGGRFLLQPRRGFRGRGRQVLRLDTGAGAGAGGPRRVRHARPTLRAGPAAELRGTPPPRPGLAPAGVPDHRGDGRSHRGSRCRRCGAC